MPNPPEPFVATLNANRTEATIEIEGVKVTVSASRLEFVLAKLGQLRGAMTPPIAAQPQNAPGMLPIATVSADHVGPNKAPSEMGATLTFASPYFGWFQYQLSPEACRGLSNWLVSPGPSLTLN
jgi:hypothetical protein